MFPPSYDVLVSAYAPVQAGEARLQEVLTGFIDPNAADDIPPPPVIAIQRPTMTRATMPTATMPTARLPKKEDLGPDPVEADKRLQSIFRRHKRVLADMDKVGSNDKKVMKASEKLADEDHGAQARAQALRPAGQLPARHGGQHPQPGTQDHAVLRP